MRSITHTTLDCIRVQTRIPAPVVLTPAIGAQRVRF